MDIDYILQDSSRPMRRQDMAGSYQHQHDINKDMFHQLRQRPPTPAPLHSSPPIPPRKFRTAAAEDDEPTAEFAEMCQRASYARGAAAHINTVRRLLRLWPLRLRLSLPARGLQYLTI
eukprot:3065772-Pyramimonas_sp.AAC.1